MAAVPLPSPIDIARAESLRWTYDRTRMTYWAYSPMGLVELTRREVLLNPSLLEAVDWWEFTKRQAQDCLDRIHEIAGIIDPPPPKAQYTLYPSRWWMMDLLMGALAIAGIVAGWTVALKGL